MELSRDNIKRDRDFKRFILMKTIPYITVCAFLAFINYMTCPNYLWVLWVIAGWGLGVAINIFEYWMKNYDNEEK